MSTENTIAVTLTQTAEEAKVSPTKGDYVVIKRNGKVRFAKVITKGAVNLGLDVADMSSNTKIPTATELVPLTVYVSQEVLESFQSEAV